MEGLGPLVSDWYVVFRVSTQILANKHRDMLYTAGLGSLLQGYELVAVEYVSRDLDCDYFP